MPISIPLTETVHFRYIHINPATNRVHLLVPFIAGMDVSTDNTCKSDVELRKFFNNGAFNELKSYKSTLEFHLSLLKESDGHYRTKKERLDQINRYLEAVVSMRDSYKTIVTSFLSKSSNLYSIQLRPRVQDPVSHVVNPVFTINRKNDIRGKPQSHLYNKMHEVFPGLELGKPDPRTDLINNTLKRLSENATFDEIKHILKSQCSAQFKIDIDVESWIKPIPGKKGIKEPIDKEHIDAFMGFSDNASSEEYIDALLGICAPYLWGMLPGSPFYNGIYNDNAHQTDSLSVMTQFYLGVLNVYCRAKGISDRNFGLILDGSSSLSQELVEIVAKALRRGQKVETLIFAFINRHRHEFNLSEEKLNSKDKQAIIQKFEATYRTVTSTKENPHMDDFMFLDREAQGENDIFITHNGFICTDASNIIPITSQNQDYFAEIRREARLHRDIVIPQNESVITIDIEPEALMDILRDLKWERLPVDIVEACRVHPAFKVREFLGDVAKGKQDEAHAILESSEDKQTLLRTPGKFTDYSGRTFRSTAYEYAYWAKDKHMMRMLERHMDDETRAFMLEKIDAMEQVGLSYQQHGITYQNAHYDMSFVLKKLSADEFRQLQTMVGQSNPKIQQATADNYKNVSFTATEYEALKKTLAQHRPKGILGLFYSSTVTALSKKLQFDFNSLITALDDYLTIWHTWGFYDLHYAWMKVGLAQRDVPAHIAHEYCRPDRSFDPLPSFNEETLPRVLAFDNSTMIWFSSSLGVDYVLIGRPWGEGGPLIILGEIPSCDELRRDLAAVRHLDEVRIAELSQSRENLSRPANQLGLAP